MKILHVITDLDTGGAEIMLYKLLVSMHDEGLNSMVISLMDRGKITERIEKLGVKVIMLGLAQGERPSLKTIKKLKKFVEQSGLLVTRCSGLDLLYTFSELGKFKGNNIQKGTFGYWFSHKFENTYLKNWGAQSVVIAVKEAEIMHCFFCGQLNAFLNSLQKYDVPTCDNCEMVNKNINYYII